MQAEFLYACPDEACACSELLARQFAVFELMPGGKECSNLMEEFLGEQIGVRAAARFL
jgi:hypothetical protein